MQGGVQGRHLIHPYLVGDQELSYFGLSCGVELKIFLWRNKTNIDLDTVNLEISARILFS